MIVYHAHNEHKWEGGRSDFHAIIVCSCGKCDKDSDEIQCSGKQYSSWHVLHCPFYFLLRM